MLFSAQPPSKISYLMSPLLSPLSLLYLIPPEIATCSLVFQMQVVSDLIEGWSTFASVALSTSVSTFSFFCRLRKIEVQKLTLVSENFWYLVLKISGSLVFRYIW